ncbi:hypothetical protein [Sphingobium tyrosinilyticum]|uniref:Amidohydrolase n=1 Tax=Sphingobium tyrosinilyticum TaxID=2715436 RepID=A0ABV9F493_9SPHN
MISREKEPSAFGVVTVGAIQAGHAGNIIPDEAVIRGTIRSQDDKVRAKLIAGVKRTAKSVADMAAAPAAPTISIAPGADMVFNDTVLSARLEALFKAAFGTYAQPFPSASSGAEDFSEFVKAGRALILFHDRRA